MAAPNPDVLIEQLKLLLQKHEAFHNDDTLRIELQRLIRQASRALETPQETIQRTIFSVRMLAILRAVFWRNNFLPRIHKTC